MREDCRIKESSGDPRVAERRKNDLTKRNVRTQNNKEEEWTRNRKGTDTYICAVKDVVIDMKLLSRTRRRSVQLVTQQSKEEQKSRRGKVAGREKVTGREEGARNTGRVAGKGSSKEGKGWGA